MKQSELTFTLLVPEDHRIRLNSRALPGAIFIACVACWVSALASLSYAVFASASWAGQFGVFVGTLGFLFEGIGWKRVAEMHAQALFTAVSGRISKFENDDARS